MKLILYITIIFLFSNLHFLTFGQNSPVDPPAPIPNSLNKQGSAPKIDFSKPQFPNVLEQMGKQNMFKPVFPGQEINLQQPQKSTPYSPPADYTKEQYLNNKPDTDYNEQIKDNLESKEFQKEEKEEEKGFNSPKDKMKKLDNSEEDKSGLSEESEGNNDKEEKGKRDEEDLKKKKKKKGKIDNVSSDEERLNQKDDLSGIEKLINGVVEQSAQQPIKQFGYEIFDRNISSFSPVADVPVGPDYIVGPGDSFILNLWGKYNIRESVVIDRTGNIFLPEIGAINVWGLTVKQLEGKLRATISKYYSGFQFTITFTALRTINVFLIGETQNPGNFKMSSLTTMFNSLFQTGGPKKTGSLRDIKLIRDGKAIATLDVYDFLLKGTKSSDQRLLSGDTIFIPPLKQTFGISGYVKRPAIYEFPNSEVFLKDLINLAGGISLTGYLGRIQVVRIEEHSHKALIDFVYNEEDFKKSLETDGTLSKNFSNTYNFKLKNGDLVRVFPILPGTRGIVFLTGHINRPGEYQFKEGIRLKDLLPNISVFLPDPFMKYGNIFRLERPTSTQKIISFSPEKLMTGDETANLLLEDQDIIKIFSQKEIEHTKVVYVTGAVKNPGMYPYISSMKLLDLIYNAGNVNPDAYFGFSYINRGDPPFSKNLKIVRFDLKKLLEGETAENISLEEMDEVRILSKKEVEFESYVFVTGAVKKPGGFRFINDMKIKDLLLMAGNVTPEAYYGLSIIERGDPPFSLNKITVNFDLKKVLEGDEAANLKLLPTDIVKILNRKEVEFTSVVTINGSVKRPGIYKFIKGMKVRELITLAGNITPEAYMEYFTIERGDPPYSNNSKILTFNLRSVMNEELEILLSEQDIVNIFSRKELEDASTVKILGNVKKPGEYAFLKDMRLKNLVMMAGNVTKNAYLKQAEIVRFKFSQEGTKTERIYVDLGKALEDDPKENLLLEKSDNIYIRPIPDYNAEQTVEITGEVRFPGKYSFKKGEKLSAIIKRAGGFTEEGYLPGAFFTRISVKEIQQKRLENYILRQQEAIAREKSKISETTLDLSALATAEKNIAVKEEILNKMLASIATGRVVIKMDKLTKFENSEFDIPVENGDTLNIPKRPSTVNILGEVYNPNGIIFEEDEDVEYYLDKVGGITEDADDGNLFIVKIDGTVISQRNTDGIIFGRFLNEELNPGDTILVPRDFSYVNVLGVVKDVTSIIFQLATTAGVLVNITGL